MLILTNAGGTVPHKLQLVTSAAATLDVHISFVDLSGTTVTPGSQNTAVTTATTTDILAAPASGVARNAKEIQIRNKHATTASDVTIVLDQNGTDFEIHKTALEPGEALEYIEGIGFFLLEAAAKLNKRLVTTADVVNATTSFADITGLTWPVESGKTYCIDARLIHANNASTTGSRFGFNGPAMTYMVAATIDTVTESVTASVHSAGAVTALETAITAQTTGSTANGMAVVSGTIVPSANGTFAMRFASEVAVAAGITVRRGSWLHIRESDNS